ncbi:MAG: hypothetical protein KGI52_16895 [Burkholderiales bacterium]|nr:hypothetical protein [Burkholderiales bacterium]
MARARNIKPAIMDNEDLSDLDPLTRLLFVYLWMLADREGRLEDRPKRIAAQALPYDRTANVDEMLQELADGKFITRYEVNDIKVIQITSFLKHQTPHGTERDSVLPDEYGKYTVHSRGKNGYATGEFVLVDSIGSVKEQLDNGGLTVKTLSPNTLIPDSLIPDSLIPEGNTAKTGDADLSPSSQPADANGVQTSQPKDECPHQAVIALFHQVLPSVRHVRDWTPARAQLLRSRWREDTKRQNLEWWRKFFAYVGQSDFLMGRTHTPGRKPFELGLEWLLKAENFAKVREGAYHEAEVSA